MKWWQRALRATRYPEVWVVTGLALLTRLWQIGWPQSIVFDEVYFRTFAGDYLTGRYFFDIHPPFTKLLFAGIATIFHLSPDQTMAGDVGATVLRILPALAGAALVPLVYIILHQLKFGRHIATIGSLLILFDNALLVESRFVLMDSVLLLAGFGAFSAYLAFRRAKGGVKWAWIILISVLLGILVSTKWTGLAMAGLIGATWLIDSIRQRRKWHRLLGEALSMLAIITFIYVGSFVMHFTLLNRTGDGDAFMSARFQATLMDSAFYNPEIKLSMWDKLVELNMEMYTAQHSLTDVTHPYASSWYSWPFMVRPVYYWQGETLHDGTQGNIYLLGNPVVWLVSFVSLVVAAVLFAVRPRWLGKRRMLVGCLLLGYALNFVPFVFIHRPMFLYHYLFAFILTIFIACVILERFFDWQLRHHGRAAMERTIGVFVAAVLFSFLYFLPLSYGWPLSPADLQQHMWLSTWR